MKNIIHPSNFFLKKVSRVNKKTIIIFSVLILFSLAINFSPLYARTVKMLKEISTDVFNVIGSLVVEKDATVKGNLDVGGSLGINTIKDNLLIGGYCWEYRTGSAWSNAAYSGCSITGTKAACENNHCKCSTGYTLLSTGGMGYAANVNWHQYFICVK